MSLLRRRARPAPAPAVPETLHFQGAGDHELFEVAPEVAMLRDATSPSATAFRGMAVSLIDRHLSTGCRGVALCGASKGVGVTYTAVNLAVALAAAGVRTLLVEANLRDPSLDSFIKPHAAAPGLQQMLREGLDRLDVTHVEPLPNLSLVYAGGAAPDPDVLLANPRFKTFVRECMRDYECAIVDTPAANRAADARLVAATVGYAAVVGRRRFTFAEDANLLARQLADDGAKVIGSIFNEG